MTLSLALIAGIALLSCKPQKCDYMYYGKLVYLRKPYKATCPYDNKEYKVYAHLYLDIWNNAKIGVVKNIPKEFRIYDTTDVMVSFTNVPSLPDIPGFKDGITFKDVDDLPTEFVIIDCVEKAY